MYNHLEYSGFTLQIIEYLNKHGIKVTTLTKGLYSKELVNCKRFGIYNEYGITLVFLDDAFKKKYEPFSAPFDKRIESLRYLHESGLKTWVSMEPYPTPNIVKQDISIILEKIGFVDKIIFGKHNYNVDSGAFKNHMDFYREQAEVLIKFCKENGVKYHIKVGTPKFVHETADIFSSKK